MPLSAPSVSFSLVSSLTIFSLLFSNGCYAFASTTAIEIAYYVKTRESKIAGNSRPLSYPLLSPQFAMDCTPSVLGVPGAYGGCNTGFACFVHEFIASTGGNIPLNVDYPFEGVSGKCDPTIPTFKTGMLSYTFVQNNSQMLDAIVNNGAVVASVNTLYFESFQTNNPSQAFEGCYNRSNEDTNHVVTIVGWQLCVRSDGTKLWCWQVLNSYGDRWGYNGYVLLPMDPAGDCGIFGSDKPGPESKLANWIKRVSPIITFN